MNDEPIFPMDADSITEEEQKEATFCRNNPSARGPNRMVLMQRDPSDPIPQLYPLKYFVQRLGITRHTLEKALKAGELKGLRIRGRWRISAQAAEDWVAQQNPQITEATEA